MGDAVSVTPDGRGGRRTVNAPNIRLFRRGVGMVFQGFSLRLHRTVLGNVAEALVHVLGKSRRETEEIGLDALAKVGMAAFRDRYPNRLSGGQQRRVVIARVLAMRLKRVLLDEPTSALDPELAGDLRIIRALAEEGATILFVTHEMTFARDVSNRMIFLHKGTVAQDDAPEELLRNPATEAVQRFLSNVLSRAA